MSSKEEKLAARETLRKSNIEALDAVGVSYEFVDRERRIKITDNKKARIDFWPSTGSWSVFGIHKSGDTVESLIEYLENLGWV